MDRSTIREAVRALNLIDSTVAPMKAALFVLVAIACGEPATPRDSASPGRPSTVSDGSGLVVWESNRSGAWRIWSASLESRAPRQLTADESGRRHCCPHISPDGRRIVFLSLPAGPQRYLDDDARGSLRWVTIDGREGGEVAEGARTYFEHRAAVWVSENELRYIAADRSVRTADLRTGVESTTLEPQPDEARRWLIDPTGRWAASGRAVLAPVEDGRLGRQVPLPGCQPYFTSDGRWAFWTAGAGGPIDRYDLATGEASTMLEKGDARLPADRGYLYFPMLSSDRTLLAFAASGAEHDHFRADYDVFVAEVDPESLEVLADPLPVAADPAVDRFPDVWRRPLELGRIVGETPLDVRVAAPDGESREWRLGSETAIGPVFESTLTEPGVYPITARGGDGRLNGVVVATAPPVPVPPSRGWPSRTDGNLWSWARDSARATTTLQGPGLGSSGEVLNLAEGSAVAQDSADLLFAGLRRTNRFSLELEVVPPRESSSELGAIVSIGSDANRENLLLGERGGRLILRLRVGPKAEPFAEADLGPADRTPAHLVLTYTPGRLVLFRDGREVLRTTALRGHFFHWRPYPLVLGDRWKGGARWSGTLDRIAVYDRLLSAEEVAVNARLSRDSRAP